MPVQLRSAKPRPLMRKGAAARVPTRMVNGIMIFDVPADSPRITTERVRELESELE
ncbi:MAG: hypothetical protein ABSD39_00390 [Terriglobales bacterium]